MTVSYSLDDGVATIAMDDGKANALSPQMFTELNEAFDKALADDAIVIFTGREGRFSGGFDLATLTSGGDATLALLRAGFELSVRMLEFPRPVIVACPGHAIAMAAFLLLSADYRIGADGSFKIVANEVTLGMTMPFAAIEVCRQRLAPAHFHRAINLSEVYSPSGAIEAGFLDVVVQPEAVMDTARAKADDFATLNRNAHAASKLRAREPSLTAIKAAIEADDQNLRAMLAGS